MEPNSYTDALRRGQQQFADALRTGQQAWSDAMEHLTSTWSQSVQQATHGQAPVDPAVVIDQVFDFAVRMLEGQRQFTKNLVRLSAENLRRGNPGGSGDGTPPESTD